jgi:hypothetical protein
MNCPFRRLAKGVSQEGLTSRSSAIRAISNKASNYSKLKTTLR